MFKNLEPLNIYNQGIGFSKNSDSVLATGLPGIVSISPLSGSIYGGTLLTILGNGFDNNTQVFLQNIKCNTVNININSLSCLTASRISSLVNIVIKY